jgi:hypothetical protein
MAFIPKEVPTGVVDGSNKVFTLANDVYQIDDIFVSDIAYTQGYTRLGSVLTLNFAPPLGASIHVDYWTSAPVILQDGMDVDDIKDIFTVYKGNLGGAGDTEFFQWINFLEQFLYPKFVSINPNDYLQTHIVKTIDFTSAYSLPNSYQYNQVGGLYFTQSGSGTYGALNYDNTTANFTIGETVTGGTSGATGTIAYITDYGLAGTITMINVSGSFQDNETLTGSLGGSATSNGTVSSFDFYDQKLSETDFGSSTKGYWLDASNINLTPTPTTSEVYVLRYIPGLSEVTSTAESTIIPVRYKEFVQHAIEVYWQQWRQDQNGEILASQRYLNALNDMLNTIKKSPRVMRIQNMSDMYYKTPTTRYKNYL